VAARCQTCDASTNDELSLCNRCVRKLQDDLASVSWLVVELENTLTRQARFTRPSETSRSASTPLPWNDRASQAARLLDKTLRHWVGVVSDYDSTDPSQHITDTTELARWLWRNAGVLRRLDVAGEVHSEIISVIRRARVVVDRPPDLVTYGVCGGAAEQPCDAYLYGAPSRPTVECRKCGSVFQVKERLEWMLDYVRGMNGTAAEVATYLRMVGIKITDNGIRGLKRRGRIEPVGYIRSRNGKEEPIAQYRFSDVITAVSHRYERKVKAQVS
jgi:hypothetical protein